MIVDGDQDLRHVHGDKLGIYEMINNSDTVNVFKFSDGEYYLHQSSIEVAFASTFPLISSTFMFD